MKKLLFSFLFSACILPAFSQTDSLEQYTGKYRFADGSPVSEISLLIEEGKLMATSSAGNSEFRKTETKDVFDVVAFGGTATFRRNEEGSVIAVRIQVQDMDLEGTKEADTIYWIQSVGSYTHCRSNCHKYKR